MSSSSMIFSPFLSLFGLLLLAFLVACCSVLTVLAFSVACVLTVLAFSVAFALLLLAFSVACCSGFFTVDLAEVRG